MKGVEHLRQLLVARFGLASALEPALERTLAEVAAERSLGTHSVAEEAIVRPDLLRTIAGRLTVGESHFFRHADQFDTIVDIVRSRLAGGQRTSPIVIWSAGCARGEEAHAVAIQLLESIGAGSRSMFTVLGTDVSAEAIEIGQRGAYSAWSLRGVSPDYLARHFEPVANGWRLSPRVASLVELRHLSIQEQLERFPPRSVDIVLFRNVGIYLVSDAVRAIHRGIRDALREDGLLLQAATDPVPSEGFVRRGVAPGTFVLRNSRAAKARGDERPRGATSAAATPPMRSLTQIRRSLPARPRPAVKIPEPSASAPPDSRGMSYLRKAQESLHDGRTEDAITELRSALYLDPADCLARYWYCVALGEGGRVEQARHQLRELREQLTHLEQNGVLVDGTTMVRHVRDACADLEGVLE